MRKGRKQTHLVETNSTTPPLHQPPRSPSLSPKLVQSHQLKLHLPGFQRHTMTLSPSLAPYLIPKLGPAVWTPDWTPCLALPSSQSCPHLSSRSWVVSWVVCRWNRICRRWSLVCRCQNWGTEAGVLVVVGRFQAPQLLRSYFQL